MSSKPFVLRPFLPFLVRARLMDLAVEACSVGLEPRLVPLFAPFKLASWASRNLFLSSISFSLRLVSADWLFFLGGIAFSFPPTWTLLKGKKDGERLPWGD